MKTGDLVRCREDTNVIYGLGIVTDETTRMVKVWWFTGFTAEECGGYVDDWNWKTNLELTCEDSK
jgi:hypothetical protein